MDLNNEENSKIFYAIADVFQQAQSSYVGHRKHIAVLKKIYAKTVLQGYEDAFNFWFNKLVTKILPLKKNEAIGDRIVKLVAAFIASLDRDIETAKKENISLDHDKEAVFSRFIDQFMRHILRGTESKERYVRYRVLQLLAVIMDNIGEIDEELYNLLMWSLNKRIYDKEPNVRMQAVFCLTKFQNDDPQQSNQIPSEEGSDENTIDDATHKLMLAIQNDSSAEVRRAALLNLVNNSITRSHILERARDVNQVNRRLVYSRILKSMGKSCFSEVDPRILDQLIKWGLEDREEPVRKACAKLISHDWLNLLDGDLIELIEKLNVTRSTIAEKTMETLFQTRSDIISKVKFPEDIWKDFTVEIAFLLRCFYIHCLNNELTEIIEMNFPEAAKLANNLSLYIKKRFHEDLLSKSDKHHLDFIIEQLLIIANKYDFSDEIGRRSMLTVVRNMLSITALSKPLIKIGLEVLKSLSINERDFVSMSIEIINDIRDDDIELQEREEQKNASRDRGDDDDKEDDDDAAFEEFRSSVENLVDGKCSTIEEDSIQHLSNEKEVNPETMLICLTRSSYMLELVEQTLEQNILITSLIDTLITPAVRNTEPKIRELGVRNLGLCCLLDIQLATENMYILGMCVSKGNADLKNIALKSIVDIFSVHGSVVVDGEGMVDSISLHKIFYKVLKNNDLPECQVTAAEGLCKLYLADVFTDDDLFETLVLSYFTPMNSSNEGLIQAFAFCIPVYCFSHINHQQRMTRIAADVLLRLCVLWDEMQTNEEYEDSSESMLKPNVIFQQLIDWTDPRKIVGQTNLASKIDIQLNFLTDVLQLFSKFEKKAIKKMILLNINAFYITAEYDLTKLREILEHVEDIIENETIDNMTIKILDKFKATLRDAVDEAEEISMNQTKLESENSDDEYSVILESTNNVSDEVGEFNQYDSENHDMLNESIGEKVNSMKRTREVEEQNLIDKDENDVSMLDIQNPKMSEGLKNVSFILPDEEESSDEMSIDDGSYLEE